MILQEAAGLTLGPYMDEAKHGKTALTVLSRGDDTTYFEINERYQTVFKKQTAPPEEKPRWLIHSVFVRIYFGISENLMLSRWLTAAIVRLPIPL